MIYRTDIAWRALCRVASAAVTALVLCGSLATGAIANGNHHMRHPYTHGRGWKQGIGWGWTGCTATIKDQFLEKMASAISVALNLVTAGTRAPIIGSCQCDDTGGKRFKLSRCRPYNRQALGCVVVGPVWYCP